MVRAFIVAGLLLLAAGRASADPILVNGSFELGPDGFSSQDVDFSAGYTGIPGWTIFGDSIDWLNPPWDVSDGIHAIDLDGRDATFSGVAQTFATVIGTEYAVRFDLSGNPGPGSGGTGLPVVKQLRVGVDGVSLDYAFDSSGQALYALNWQPIEFSFIASSTSATLSFMSLSATPNSYGALIDNVRVEAVPEPATLLLMSLGLVGLKYFSRRPSARR